MLALLDERDRDKAEIASWRSVLPMEARARDELASKEALMHQMAEALVRIRGWREIGGAVTRREFLNRIEEICDETLTAYHEQTPSRIK